MNYSSDGTLETQYIGLMNLSALDISLIIILLVLVALIVYAALKYKKFLMRAMRRADSRYAALLRESEKRNQAAENC